jgi:hypothetical protein
VDKFAFKDFLDLNVNEGSKFLILWSGIYNG